MRKWATMETASLNAETDYLRIVQLVTHHIFPWEVKKSAEFALFRTFAVPSISGLLARTGEFERRPQKRYDDTDLILSEILEHGFESERGRQALRRMNRMHAAYEISNQDYLYVLSTFVFVPFYWIELWGWRPLTQNEKQASFRFYQELGRRMHIRDIPDDLEAFEVFHRAFEVNEFVYHSDNRKIADATLRLLLSKFLPEAVHGLFRPVMYALMDEPLLHAFGYRNPPKWLRTGIRWTVRSRAFAQRWRSERKRPWLSTGEKRATYPKGYTIEELGTFPKAKRDGL